MLEIIQDRVRSQPKQEDRLRPAGTVFLVAVSMEEVATLVLDLGADQQLRVGEAVGLEPAHPVQDHAVRLLVLRQDFLGRFRCDLVVLGLEHRLHVQDLQRPRVDGCHVAVSLRALPTHTAKCLLITDAILFEFPGE